MQWICNYHIIIYLQSALVLHVMKRVAGCNGSWSLVLPATFPIENFFGKAQTMLKLYQKSVSIHIILGLFTYDLRVFQVLISQSLIVSR